MTDTFTIGGIIGENDSAQDLVINCRADVTVETTGFTEGLIGYNGSKVQKCSYFENVSISDTDYEINGDFAAVNLIGKQIKLSRPEL